MIKILTLVILHFLTAKKRQKARKTTALPNLGKRTAGVPPALPNPGISTSNLFATKERIDRKNSNSFFSHKKHKNSQYQPQFLTAKEREKQQPFQTLENVPQASRLLFQPLEIFIHFFFVLPAFFCG